MTSLAFDVTRAICGTQTVPHVMAIFMCLHQKRILLSLMRGKIVFLYIYLREISLSFKFLQTPVHLKNGATRQRGSQLLVVIVQMIVKCNRQSYSCLITLDPRLVCMHVRAREIAIRRNMSNPDGIDIKSKRFRFHTIS